MASYLFVVTLHTTLWALVAFCLPRTSFLFSVTTPPWDPVQLSSLDHPQHPFLVALTRNPTHTLAWLTVGAAFLQSWWACWLRECQIRIRVQGTDAERRIDKAVHECHKFQAFRDAWLATIATSFPVHVVLILFGAPITSYIFKTYLLALLISIMIVYCPAFAIGTPSFTGGLTNQTWVRLFIEFSAENVVEKTLVYQAVGTLVGTWIGVIPTSLDWDRPWQAWPLTPAFGGIGGYIVASVAAANEQSHLLTVGTRDKLD